MQKIVCELCGSNELTKENGYFVCNYCKTKYTLEEARKLFVTGTVSIEGEVKTKTADFVIQAGVLKEYHGESTIVTIPDNVKALGYRCFEGLGIEKVIIPSSVTSIGDWAFYDCKSLTSVTIPESVTSIGEHAFMSCSNLVSVTIPEGVTSIGHSAFHGCTSLTSVTIPEGVTSIGSAFSGCTSLTSITIPNSVTSIGGGAFGGCTSLKSITIPNSVTSIGPSAFSGCTSLTSIRIPDSVKKIGCYAFGNCTRLMSVKFLGDYQNIEFSGDCFKNTYIVLHKSLCPTCLAPNRFIGNITCRHSY